jgi:hypothetical protein
MSCEPFPARVPYSPLRLIPQEYRANFDRTTRRMEMVRLLSAGVSTVGRLSS